MHVKLHEAMINGSRTDWTCLLYALLETDIILEYFQHKQNLDLRTRKLKRIAQYTTEHSGVIINTWVSHKYAKISKVDITYFEILISLELDHIRMSTKKEEWQSEAGYQRYHFEIHPDLIIQRYYELKLEMV